MTGLESLETRTGSESVVVLGTFSTLSDSAARSHGLRLALASITHTALRSGRSISDWLGLVSG